MRKYGKGFRNGQKRNTGAYIVLPGYGILGLRRSCYVLTFFVREGAPAKPIPAKHQERSVECFLAEEKT